MTSLPYFRAIAHDLLGVKMAGTIYVTGPPDANNIVCLCAGFPCDQSSLMPLAAHLAESGCLVGVTCFPEFDREGPALRPQGYDMEETAACFAQAVAALKQVSTAKASKLSLVVHDFGVVPGFCHSNCVGCDKLVVFDVLPTHPIKDKPDRISDALVQLNYQLLFATSFKLSRVWEPLGRMWLTLGMIATFGLLRRWLNPIGPKDVRGGVLGAVGFLPYQRPDKAASGAVRPTPFRCNPYYHMLKHALNPSEIARLGNLASFEGSLAKQPICYLYGEEKNTFYHTEVQLAKLRATPGCEVHAVADAGHWLYKHAPDVCFPVVRRFILGAG